MSIFCLGAFARTSVLALVASLLLACPAAATLIIIPNASFEDPDVADNTFTASSGFMPIPNWTFAQTFNGDFGAGVWDPVDSDYTGTTGDNAALPGTASGGQVGYMYLAQTDDTMLAEVMAELTPESNLAFIQPLTIYTLTVAIGHSQTFLAGDVKVGLYRGDNQTALSETIIPSAAVPANTFADFSSVFVSPADDELTDVPLVIRVTHTHDGPGERSVDFDNVRLDVTPVPEPAGIATLALGSLAAVTRRRPRPRRRG